MAAFTGIPFSSHDSSISGYVLFRALRQPFSSLLLVASLLSSSDGAIDRRARWSGRSRERDRRGEVIRVARGASRRLRVCVCFVLFLVVCVRLVRTRHGEDARDVLL
jgi:hypothetical protein